MSDFGQALLLIGIYRVTVLLVGLAFGAMGYMLFVQGAYRAAGDLHASSGKLKVTLKNGAPGLFFALFGMSLILASLWRGIDIQRLRQSTPPQPTVLVTPQLSPAPSPVTSGAGSGTPSQGPSTFMLPNTEIIDAARKAARQYGCHGS